MTGPDSRWTVIEDTGELKIPCRCSCGTERLVNRKNLKSGATRSCGCHRREVGATLAVRRKRNASTHGMSGAPEYTAFHAMHQRCGNERCSEYPRYGGRGIRVCKRWTGPDGFVNFLADMGRRPTDSHSIERKDNNKGYGPDNCVWATDNEQNRNRGNNRNITHAGRTQCLQAWADEYGIEGNVLAGRLGMGWEMERALTEPVRRVILSPAQIEEIRRRHDPDSKSGSFSALAREFGVSYQTISRIVRNEVRRYLITTVS